MDSTSTGRRRWAARGIVVGAALTGAVSLSAVVATSASAHRGNPAKLCDQHEGVAGIGKDFVLCGDGEMIDLD